MRILAIILAFALILVPGLVHGLWTGRWVNSEELERFTANLAKVPDQIGVWHGEDVAMDAKQIAIAELSGCLARRFVHQPSGRHLLVVVACGRPGPVSLHVPQVCFPGAGFNLTALEADRSFTFSERATTAAFKMATFARSRPTGAESLQVYWSWNGGDGWQAPAQRWARFTLGRYAAVYRLYVICPFSADVTQQQADEICTDFLQALLPELQKALF